MPEVGENHEVNCIANIQAYKVLNFAYDVQNPLFTQERLPFQVPVKSVAFLYLSWTFTCPIYY